jgi:hypothetical protein
VLKPIFVEDLVLDEENPRLAEEGQSQPDILAAWSRDRKNYRLAADVAKRGLSPLELVAVIPHPDLPNRFIVVDGNRRLTALKLLSQPSLAPDEPNAKRFRQLAQQHSIQEEVSCMVFPSREEADPWIDLRHSGEAEGVGTVSWDTLQKYRFNVRRDKPDPNADSVRFLDFALDKGWITPEQQRAVPVTTLRRVLGDTGARTLLGVRLTADGPEILRAEAEAKRLVRTLLGALSEKGAVRKLDKSTDRESFVRKQLETAKAKPLSPEDVGDQANGRKSKGAPPQKTARKKHVRETLAPRQLDFTVSQPRCWDILGELQSLKVVKARNAAIILFRVFVELSTDHFLETKGTKPGMQVSLKEKITRCLRLLAGTPHDLSASKRQALEKVLQNHHHPLNPDTLNAFVHNADLNPLASDLPKLWDQIQAFMTAVWLTLEE